MRMMKETMEMSVKTKTITITLDKTLADLEEDEGLDFDCHYPEDWFVVHWHRSIDTDVVTATCNSGKNNNLTTFYGVDN